MQVMQALAFQFLAKTFGGNQCCECQVVELAQVSGDRTLEKSYPVMLAVTVEVGMESRGNGRIQMRRRHHRRPAKRDFRGDMDDVRAFQRP